MVLRLRTLVRFLFVTVGIVVITSISIDASDYVRGSPSTLGSLVHEFASDTCDAGMVPVEQLSGKTLCVDAYEAGVGQDCMYVAPATAIETAQNINDPDCVPVSEAGVLPWVHVLRVQAEQLCARAGKRLLSADEWYAAVRGTPDSLSVCILDSVLTKTGNAPECRSGSGIYDMVGNVWEWVGDTAEDGQLGDIRLPEEGYITDVSPRGVPIATALTPQVLYNNDYLWSVEQGVQSVMRGGFFGSGNDGGVYAVHAATPSSFESDSVGFRCARSL